MARIVEVLKTERHVVLASIESDCVRVGFVESDAPGDQVGSVYHWLGLTVGWVRPVRKRWFNAWLDRRVFRSVAEAIETVVAAVHRREFLAREAEAQIQASRATMKALADLERELNGEVGSC
jgi:hypothetical protein